MAEDEGLETTYQLIQRFQMHVAGCDVPALASWLVDAEASDLPSVVTLAHRIRAGNATVKAALATTYSRFEPRDERRAGFTTAITPRNLSPHLWKC